MKLKYDFMVNEVAGQFVAVAVGAGVEEFNGFVKMNDIGAEIFEILKDEVTVDEVIAKMLEKHPESNLEEATEAVNGFIDGLKKAGVIA